MASTLQLTDSNPLLLKSSLLRSSTADQTTTTDSALLQEPPPLPLRAKFDAISSPTPPLPPPSYLSPSPCSSCKNRRRGPRSHRRCRNGRGYTSPSTLASSSSTSPSSPTTPATVYIKATGEKSAEMVTDEGAIYVTANRGYNWKAAVQETVSATLNRTVSSGISGASYYTGTFNTVNRSPDGRYVAVSSRGNFYLTWEPGQPYWQPHNRAVARRIQNMGWRADGGLWLLVRGGGLYLSKGTGISEDFEEIPVQSRGFGILDVGYRSKDEAWAAGGSGVLLRTTNGGKSWTRDKAADNIAANLYSVKFLNDNKGFVLGNDGVLLRYLG